MFVPLMSHDLERSTSCERLGYSRCPANTNDLATLLMFTVDLDDCQWLQCMCTQIPNAFKVGMLSWSRRGDRETKRALETRIKTSLSHPIWWHLCGPFMWVSREVGHSTACLGTASPNTVGGDQRVGPSQEHLLIKKALHIRLTDFQFRQGRRHSEMLETGPGPCHDDKLHPRRATPGNR